ncbi:hypothetical protein BDN72DRAFT_905535 [Pluteus cervinus]|uniref:Uncharacterized protein n=1 Tax=Pluteus cervinus TaxID=181527 RepID=A0ACD3A2B9_9AGAR|nr:hypothetical protein BDN72DRAFT_905535 [Pluteus cervinus]
MNFHDNSGMVNNGLTTFHTHHHPDNADKVSINTGNYANNTYGISCSSEPTNRWPVEHSEHPNPVQTAPDTDDNWENDQSDTDPRSPERSPPEYSEHALPERTIKSYTKAVPGGLNPSTTSASVSNCHTPLPTVAPAPQTQHPVPGSPGSAPVWNGHQANAHERDGSGTSVQIAFGALKFL